MLPMSLGVGAQACLYRLAFQGMYHFPSIAQGEQDTSRMLPATTFRKTNLGIKSQEERTTIWKFENPHDLHVILILFFSGRISKFQPVLMLAHLGTLLMKTAASSNALMRGSTFQKNDRKNFWIQCTRFCLLLFLFSFFEKINPNRRAF